MAVDYAFKKREGGKKGQVVAVRAGYKIQKAWHCFYASADLIKFASVRFSTASKSEERLLLASPRRYLEPLSIDGRRLYDRLRRRECSDLRLLTVQIRKQPKSVVTTSSIGRINMIEPQGIRPVLMIILCWMAGLVMR